jgi:hypothetical protein
LRHIDLNSETARELDPELSVWGETLKTNALLADIVDLLALINSNIVALGSGKKAKKPKPIKRPGDKDTQVIGKNALPFDELRAFFEKKRQEHEKRKQKER